MRLTQSSIALAASVLVGAALFSVPLGSSFFANLGYVKLVWAILPAEQERGLVARYDPPPAKHSALLEQAEQYFRQAIAWQAWNSTAHAGLGRVLIEQGIHDRAISSLEMAVQLDGLLRYGYLAGNAEMYAGNRERALALWIEIATEPKQRLHLALTLFGQSNWDDYHPNRWDDAIYVLEDTLAHADLDPAWRATLNLRLADMYQHIGKLAEAERSLRDALALVPRDGVVRATLAWVLMARGQEDKALEEAQTALMDQPGWRAHYVLGVIHLRRCQLEDAMAEFTTGLNYPADEYRYYWQMIGLGDAYWELGRPHEAVVQWERYLQFQPNDTSMPQKIAQAQRNELVQKCFIP